ncbi:MAG: hypothetical protein HZB26_09155 [Candidatus Hydrogenedentes bacterium]|nr:hypothetical protein [Candidatus Hydrogenedentota bacterium]
MMSATKFVTAQFMSGTMFFAGLLLACGGLLLLFGTGHPIRRSIALIGATTGVLVTILSGTPLPSWAYALWSASFVAAGLGISRRWSRNLWLAFAVTAASLLMAAWEAQYHKAVKIPVAGCDTLFVVGDSLSMGADPPGKNWPELLAEKAGMTAKNYSFGGAKVASAQHNAERIDKETALVILEIGGNDLLSGTSAFEADLERMLQTVCNGKRRVAMLELPLPPLFNRYGAAQRRLARIHGVTLIPKKYLTMVLTAPNATVDGLHLSNAGHTLLAETLFSMFE